MSVPSYPLHWPHGRPRKTTRKRAAFSKKVSDGNWQRTKELSVSDAIGRLQYEIDRIGARNCVISTNLLLRLDGLPRSGQPEPQDPGVALYFQLVGQPHCMPCDTYDRVADNIAAIAKHIEATRAIHRFGVASIREMFTGFQALPPPENKKPWREVLGIGFGSVREHEIEMAYRKLAKSRHPDATGGSHDAMAELNEARDAAWREIGGGHG